MSILLTGATGFIGSAFLVFAKANNIEVRSIVRNFNSIKNIQDFFVIPDLNGEVDFSQALIGIDIVIHSAARVHIMKDQVVSPIDDYMRINVFATLNLARQAAASGVKRFVFLSSIKVNGEVSKHGVPFKADDKPAPKDLYALSKAEAEIQLMQLARQTGLEVTIIRLPLVYGTGVKGNFAKLISLIKRGFPLPFGLVKKNRRSLVCIDNLVEFILLCAYHPNAVNQIFLISDGEDVSTSDLLQRIGDAVGRSASLLYVPGGVIQLILFLLGKKFIADRLLGSLQVDLEKNYDLLKWRPSVSLNEGLRRALK